MGFKPMNALKPKCKPRQLVSKCSKVCNYELLPQLGAATRSSQDNRSGGRFHQHHIVRMGSVPDEINTGAGQRMKIITQLELKTLWLIRRTIK